MILWQSAPFGKSDARELPMIVKGKGGYKVVSSKGRNLGGPYKTLKEAKKRLRQVEFFKHRKA
jgi:hypothetical protein